LFAAWLLLVPYLACSSTLKMEAVCSSEFLVSPSKTTQCDSELVEAVTILICIREMLGSYLGRTQTTLDCNLLWVSLVPMVNAGSVP
jgi:hypothetical protein